MKKYQLGENTKLYHLSANNHNNEIFNPRIPNNIAAYENNTTPRVCASTSIRGCVIAMCADNYDSCFHIHQPVINTEIACCIYAPSTKDVPDVKETREKWITCPVKMKHIGTVMVLPFFNYRKYSYDIKLKICWD